MLSSIRTAAKLRNNRCDRDVNTQGKALTCQVIICSCFPVQTPSADEVLGKGFPSGLGALSRCVHSQGSSCF